MNKVFKANVFGISLIAGALTGWWMLDEKTTSHLIVLVFVIIVGIIFITIDRVGDDD